MFNASSISKYLGFNACIAVSELFLYLSKVPPAINPSFCNSNAIFFERVFITNVNKQFKNTKKNYFKGFCLFFNEFLPTEYRSKSCQNYFLANFVENDHFFHKIKKKLEKKLSTKIWWLFTLEKWNFIILNVCLVKKIFFNFFIEKRHFLHTHAKFGRQIIKIAFFIAILFKKVMKIGNFSLSFYKKKLPVQNV